MAFTKGQLITASELNNVGNSFNLKYSVGDHGYSGYSGTWYFYTTRPSGTSMVNLKIWFGWNSWSNLDMYRMENGTWVNKYSSHESSGWWSWDYGSGGRGLNSYGEGLYKITFDHGHFSSIDGTCYPSKNNNTKGNYLKMISPSMSDSNAHIESGSQLTADALNAGRVYTV